MCRFSTDSDPSRESNPGPSRCEAAVLTTVPSLPIHNTCPKQVSFLDVTASDRFLWTPKTKPPKESYKFQTMKWFWEKWRTPASTMPTGHGRSQSCRWTLHVPTPGTPDCEHHRERGSIAHCLNPFMANTRWVKRFLIKSLVDYWTPL